MLTKMANFLASKHLFPHSTNFSLTARGFDEKIVREAGWVYPAALLNLIGGYSQ